MLVLKYIMHRGANMRGTHFVKFLSDTQGASATDAHVVLLATQPTVLSIVTSPKAGAESDCNEEGIMGFCR